MKILLTLSLLLLTSLSFAQSTNVEQFEKAHLLMEKKQLKEAYEVYIELKKTTKQTDTLYGKVIFNYISCATELEKEARLKMDFTTSLQYGLDALQTIKQNSLQFGAKFVAREYWMTKNVIVSYFGLNKPAEAVIYKEVLYKAYKNHKLPKDIENYFNYDYFKLDGKNVWGYEWYPELPADRISTSFTKVIYYIYSSNADGTDKEQLSRYHVVMYRKVNDDLKFDYILEKQQDIDSMSVSGTYNQYTYHKDIDYLKLRKDVKYIVTHNIQPDTKKTVKLKQ